MGENVAAHGGKTSGREIGNAGRIAPDLRPKISVTDQRAHRTKNRNGKPSRRLICFPLRQWRTVSHITQRQPGEGLRTWMQFMSRSFLSARALKGQATDVMLKVLRLRRPRLPREIWTNRTRVVRRGAGTPRPHLLSLQRPSASNQIFCARLASFPLPVTAGR